MPPLNDAALNPANPISSDVSLPPRAHTDESGPTKYTISDSLAVEAAIAAAARGDNPSERVAPPGEAEKYAYLGTPRRWVLPTMSLLTLPLLLSLIRFSTSHIALLLFAPWVVLLLLSNLVGAWSSNRRWRLSLSQHKHTVENYRPDRWPSVDVFLPTAGEPLEVLVNTYRHVSGLSYPGQVKVHVLDDADRSEVAAAAARFSFDYIVRPDRGYMKKAGNMRHAFSRTNGDLILVLDADFVPRPDMLNELVPYFEAENIGIVQSPQYFDTHPEQNWLQRTAGSTQELFYRWVQPSRDAAGVAICVGTCAIYRRKALQAAGGFAQIEHSEDVHTGVNLRKVGFGLRYVPVLLAKGLCPDQIKPFISQQYRWATGSLSLMRDKDFYARADLNIDRLSSYASGFLYYITTALSVFAAALPGPVMMWFYTDDVRPANYIPFLGLLVNWLLILPAVSQSRWRLDVLRVQMLYSFAHARAILDIVQDKTAGWVATGDAKAANPVAFRTIRMMRTVLTVNLGLIWGGLIHALSITNLEQIWPAFGFAAVYTYIAGPLLAAPRVVTWRGLLRSPLKRYKGQDSTTGVHSRDIQHVDDVAARS